MALDGSPYNLIISYGNSNYSFTAVFALVLLKYSWQVSAAKEEFLMQARLTERSVNSFHINWRV